MAGETVERARLLSAIHQLTPSKTLSEADSRRIVPLLDAALAAARREGWDAALAAARAEVEGLPVERIEASGPIGGRDGIDWRGWVEVVSRAAVLAVLARLSAEGPKP